MATEDFGYNEETLRKQSQMPRKTEEKVILLTDKNESKQWIYFIFTKPAFIISSQNFIIIMDRLTCFYLPNKIF